MGNVYFVRAGKHVKVGFTTDVPRRLSQLQTGCAEPLMLLAVIPGGTMLLERQIHELLAQYRSHGEWFHYRGKARAFIRAVVGGARPTTPGDLKHLWEFATGHHVLLAARRTIANLESTHEQLRDAHITARDLTQ